MKKSIATGLIAMLCGLGFSATAQTTATTPMTGSASMNSTMPSKDGMPMKDGMAMHGGMTMNMKMMDTNGDGMISRAEFNKYHAAMWTKMKKNKNGMVSMDDMKMMTGDNK